MANIIKIDDLCDSRVKYFSKMTESQLRQDLEFKNGIFIAESPKVIERALDAGYEPISFLTSPKHIEGDAKYILDRCNSVPVYTGEDSILESITGFSLTRGVFCAMKRPDFLPVETVCANARRIAILENIAESTNVGTIFRSAAALNIDAVLVTPGCCDPLCRRSVRVSMGTIFQVPWTKIGTDSLQWSQDGVDQVKKLGFKSVAMALTDKSISLDNKELLSQEKIAIILGTEGEGLLQNTIDSCDYTVKIPMTHGVDSLNVACAGAIAFWQLTK